MEIPSIFCLSTLNVLMKQMLNFNLVNFFDWIFIMRVITEKYCSPSYSITQYNIHLDLKIAHFMVILCIPDAFVWDISNLLKFSENSNSM